MPVLLTILNNYTFVMKWALNTVDTNITTAKMGVNRYFKMGVYLEKNSISRVKNGVEDGVAERGHVMSVIK